MGQSPSFMDCVHKEDWSAAARCVTQDMARGRISCADATAALDKYMFHCHEAWDTTLVATLVLRGARLNNSGLGLHRALCTGATDSAGLLVLAGADINVPCVQHDKQTPLHLLCRFAPEAATMAEMLLDFGADLEARDVMGRTPLLTAAQYGTCELVQILLDRGARVDAVDIAGRGVGILVLRDTTSSSHCVEKLHLFIKAGASLEGTDRGRAAGIPSEVPLWYATVLNRVDLVEVLLAGGADASVMDDAGRNALSLLCEAPVGALSEGTHIFRALIQNGAGTEARTRLANTLAETARIRGHWDIVALLI